MKKALRSLAKTQFVRDATLLQTGAFVTMGLQFVLSIALARLLGVTSFGLYTLILTAVTTLSVVLDAGEGYSMLTLFSEAYGRKSRQELTSVLKYYVVITLRWTTPVVVVLICATPFFIPLVYKTAAISLWVQIGLFTLLFTPIHELTQLTLQGVRNIRALTVTDILFGFLDGAIPLLFLTISPTITSVMLGRLASAVFKAATCLWFWRTHLGPDPLLPTFRELMRAKRPPFSMFKLGFWIAANKQSSKVIGYVPYYLLGLAGLPQVVGQYKSFSSYLSISGLFSGTVSRLLGSVLPQVYSRSHSAFNDSFWKGNIGNMLVTVVILLPLLLLGNTGLTFLYGPEYAVPPMAFALIFLTCFDGITVGFGSYYRIHNAIHLAILNQVGSLLVGLLAWWLVPTDHPLVSVVLLTVVSSTFSKCMHFLCFRWIERHSPRTR